MRYRTVVPLLVGWAVVLLGGVAPAAAQQRRAEVALQQALHVEQVEGDLQRAISLYRRIVAEHTTDRPVAAQAQLHIGLCLEQLGLTEAQQAYQSVIDGFPEQREVVTAARERLVSLAALRQPPAMAEESAILLRQLPAEPGFMDGGPMPDAGSFVYIDYSTGDVALKNLVSG
jgi:tetratricopeptide (TPR) repeat protein